MCPIKIPPTDFSKAGQAIADSDELTTEWLRNPAVGTVDPLGPHGHPAG